MSKNRKRVFPKPPQRLNSETAKSLGKNSHKFKDEYQIALYKQSIRPSAKPELTELQKNMLARLKGIV